MSPDIIFNLLLGITCMAIAVVLIFGGNDYD